MTEVYQTGLVFAEFGWLVGSTRSRHPYARGDF